MSPWLPLILSFIGGGLAGAIVNNILIYLRSRKQTIKYLLAVDRIFTPQNTIGGYDTIVTLNKKSEGFNRYEFKSLYLIQFAIENTGNQDYSIFSFGLKMPDSHIIAIATNSEAPLHELSYEPNVNPGHIADKMLFTLNPFNRRDAYSFNLYVTREKDDDFFPINQINLDTKHPVKLVRTDAEIVLIDGIKTIYKLNLENKILKKYLEFIMKWLFR